MLEKIVDKLKSHYTAIGILATGVLGDTVTTQIGISKHGISIEANETAKKLMETNILAPNLSTIAILSGVYFGLYLLDGVGAFRKKGVSRDPVIYYLPALVYLGATISNIYQLAIR